MRGVRVMLCASVMLEFEVYDHEPLPSILNLIVPFESISVLHNMVDELDVVFVMTILEIIGYVSEVVKFASPLSVQPPDAVQDFTVYM